MDKSAPLTRLMVLALSSLIADRALADQPLAPPDEAPAYQLSNIRVEDDRFGRGELVVDFRRTRDGNGAVYVGGKTPNGALTVLGFPVSNEASGEIRLRQTFGSRRGQNPDVEIYLTTPASWAGKSFGQCMISNAVRLGNPGPTTSAREWNREERAAYEKNKLATVPPASIEKGFEPITAETTLVPGMPIRAGSYGDWIDGEVISLLPDGRVNVKLPNQPLMVSFVREKWLAADPVVLRRARTDPGRFTPSLRVLPEGRLALPENAIALDPNEKLLIGTPLLFEWGADWQTAYVVYADAEGVTVRFEGRSSAFDREYPKRQFAIDRDTLRALAEPESVQRFAANVASSGDPSASAFPTSDVPKGGLAKSAPKRKQSYPVTIAVPPGAQIVPDDLPLEPGIPLAACYGGRWNHVSVLSENDDGTVNIHWDKYSDSWDCSLSRDQLIIEDKTVRKLRRNAGTASQDVLAKTRTWTDASGRHKIEAKFVSKTETDVTLKTDAGREITLSISKLSEEDQQLLASVTAEVDNPFDP